MAGFDRVLKLLREICGTLPEVHEVIAWGHPNFRAGKKTFAVLEEHRGELSLAIQVDPLDQQRILADPRFYLTPYIGPKGWVSLRVGGKIDPREVRRLVIDSYRRAANKRMLLVLDGGEPPSVPSVKKPAPTRPRSRTGRGRA